MSSSSGLCNSIQSEKSPSESERVESLFDMISLILGRADKSFVKLKAKIAVRRQQYWEVIYLLRRLGIRKKSKLNIHNIE